MKDHFQTEDTLNNKEVEGSACISAWANLLDHSGPFGTVWDCLGPFGTVWDRLGPFGTVRDRLELFGTIREY